MRSSMRYAGCPGRRVGRPPSARHSAPSGLMNQSADFARPKFLNQDAGLPLDRGRRVQAKVLAVTCGDELDADRRAPGQPDRHRDGGKAQKVDRSHEAQTFPEEIARAAIEIGPRARRPPG